MLRRLPVLLLPLLLFAACAHASGGATTTSTRADGQATVTRVVDGDTIVVDLGGRTEKVRLIGIDTPETKDPRKPVQCYGKEASKRTEALLPPGTAVRLERDVELRDRYGRLLAYVFRLRDGLFVNLELARGGYAQVLTIPPNVANSEKFVAAVADARRAGRGLWSACGAVASGA